jgi:hypothetical protein
MDEIFNLIKLWWRYFLLLISRQVKCPAPVGITKQRLIGSGKDARDRERDIRGRGEVTDSDEDDNTNKRRKRMRASKAKLKRLLDSPDSHKGAFPSDKRRKSLGQKKN